MSKIEWTNATWNPIIGCFPLSELGLTIEDVKKMELKKVYEKGTPILWENFNYENNI